jgi:hypothetical protein
MTLGHNRVKMPISFAPNGSSAVSAASIKGAGVYSVARTSQGLFTITLKEVWQQLDAAIAVVQLAAAAARWAQIGAVDLAAKTIQVRVVDASGNVQDVAADTNNRINLELTLRYGSLD